MAKKKLALPEAQIRFLVGRLSVGRTDAEVAADIGDRARKQGWPSKEIERAEKLAIKIHHENQDLYGYVMRGR